MMENPSGLEHVECFTYVPPMDQHATRQYVTSTPQQRNIGGVMPSQQHNRIAARARNSSVRPSPNQKSYWHIRNEASQHVKVLLRTQPSGSKNITVVMNFLKLKYIQEDLKSAKLEKRGDVLRFAEDMGFAVLRTHKVDENGRKYDCNATVALRVVDLRELFMLEHYISDRVVARLRRCGYSATPSELLKDLLGDAAPMGDSYTLLRLLEDEISFPTRPDRSGFTIEMFPVVHDPYAVVVKENWHVCLNGSVTTTPAAATAANVSCSHIHRGESA